MKPSKLSRLGSCTLAAFTLLTPSWLAGCGGADTESGGQTAANTSGGELSFGAGAPLRPGLTVRGTTLGAGDHIQLSCGAGTVGTSDVAFVFTPPSDGAYTFTTQTEYDGTLAVYEGAAELGCNDDDISTQTSRLELNLRAGVAYRVIVDGYGTNEGAFNLTVSEPAPPRAQLGGLLAVGSSVRGATSAASDTRTLPCGAPQPGSGDATYRFIAPEDGRYAFATTTDYDGVLAVYEGGTVLDCNDDHGDTAHSRIVLMLRQGQAVDVVVDGYNGSDGTFELSASRVVIQPPQLLALGQDARGSTVNGSDAYAPDCGSRPGTPDQVWRFTPQVSGDYRFRLDSDYDGVLAVYAPNTSQPMYCNDDAGSTRASEVVGPLQAGQTYDVVVDGFGGGSGSYTLRADFGVGASIGNTPPGYPPSYPPALPPGPSVPPPVAASIHGGPLPENITAMEARCTAATAVGTGHYSVDLQGESTARLSCGSGGAGADGTFVIDLAEASLVSLHVAADFPVGVELRRGCSREVQVQACEIQSSPAGIDLERSLPAGRYTIVIDALDGVARGVAHLDVNIRPSI